MLRMMCAAFMVTVSFGLVIAEEHNGVITKVDGDKITFQKTKGFGKKSENVGDPITLTASKDVKVNKAKVSFKDKKLNVEVGDAIEGGLKAEIFTKISEKGIRARVTTDKEDKVVSEILVFTGGKGKKKDNK